jgi:Kef-type K+ transport system membrane component KefB
VDVGELLLRLAVALLAARVAAEIAERLRQPAVLFEIAAGVILGPSLLGLVHGDEVIRALGELGAVLLLFEVGLHMDLRELGRVGRSALQVAAVGVVTPMVLAYPVLRALGVSPRIAIFLAAGITATSVGITARVFSDLRALASSEARTVLGAAVADDVAGLVILAIVVGAESESGVAVGSLAGTIGFALLFLLGATVVGVWLVPRIIGRLSRASRTDGTSMILALVVTLALAGFASDVKLAPVVGAFVAGLAVGPSARREEIQRRLAPIGQVLIPLFFLYIGIDTQLGAFTHARVLGIAAALTAIAVIGKIAAGLGVKRGTADRLLVGIAMIPRGEVGLIFASIGLSQHFLDPRSHSILVATVMASTVISPALIRARIRHIRRAEARGAAAAEPAGGWLTLTHDEVELAAEPPVSVAPQIALDAAVASASRRPGSRLLRWLSELPPGEDVAYDDELRARFFRLLGEGTQRSWRFLEVTGMLARLLPDLEAVVGRRARDPFDLDPGAALRFDALEGLQRLEADPRDPASELWAAMAERDILRLASLARDALDPEDIDGQTARLAAKLGLDDESLALLATLVSERHLLPAASRRIDMGSEDMVLELATHLGSPAIADALYILAVAEDAMDPTERERLDELHQLVKTVLEHPDVVAISGGDILEQKRREALGALGGQVHGRNVREHLEDAPARYLLAQSPDAIARHIRMIETRPVRFEVRLEAELNDDPGAWKVHLAFLDRRGALAAVAWGFSQCRVSVHEALVSTWRSDIAIDVFKVTAPPDVDWDAVRKAISGELEHPHSNGVPPMIEGSVDIDNQGSPWYSIVEVRARDRAGLLYRVASALARAGTDIHNAQVTTRDGVAVDTFGVTGRNGAKLDEAGQKAVRLAFAGKTPLSWRTPLRRFTKAGRR